MREIVPEINSTLKRSLAGHPDPILVAVRPQPNCEVGNCWENIPALIDRYGGSLVSGRIIWIERTGKWLHLEAHCNWVMPDGEIIDPTPKEDGEKEIVFVEEKLRFKGSTIPCRFICCSENRLVKRYVKILQRTSEIRAAMLAGKTKGIPSEFIALTHEQARLLPSLDMVVLDD